ncbi:MAG: hypothetical protein LBU62_08675 [Bacteroidales bacterium]|jgi:hypothetical protein|nr:hypothetical protein [Bacteroidales bacterium]
MIEWFRKLTFALSVLLTGLISVNAQPPDNKKGEDEEAAMSILTHTDTIENPVYMPVVGIGAGYFGFHGELKNSFNSLTVGKPAIRVNISSYIGQTHRLRANLVFITGDVYGTQRTVPQGLQTDGTWSLADTAKNLNFKSTIYSFGFNLHYSFKPLIRGKYLEPFVSVGLETMSFNSSADYLDKNGMPYHYWSDGTIRIVDEISGTAYPNPEVFLTQRDYNYETNMRALNKKVKYQNNGLKRYSNFTFSIPVDVGFDLNISERLTLRAATSLHYTFTDLLDDMTYQSKNADYKGTKGNDWFTFSYLSLHLDLFSQDKVKVVEKLFANADDFDMAMYDDEDNDGVFDGWDDCPGTPADVLVDTLGCPFDNDDDGVPDYLDREMSHVGAVVDEFGVEVNDETVVELVGQPALSRRDVAAYLSRSQVKVRRVSMPIPDKFRKVDKNRDGYISFDEMLATIDAYFDGTSNFSSGDIKDLNNFFFDQ